MRKIGKRIGVFAAGVLPLSAAMLFASPAGAFHIPGANYNGPAGTGTITFTVSGDGSSVNSGLRLDNVQGSTCTLIYAQYNQPISIFGHQFDNGEIAGEFDGVQHARGTMSIYLSGFPPCVVSGTWSATTSADPSGSQECRDATAAVNQAQAAVNTAKQKVAKAKKAVKKAEDAKAKKKAKRKLRKAKQQLANAENQLAGAQQNKAAVCGGARRPPVDLGASSLEVPRLDALGGAWEMEVIPRR